MTESIRDRYRYYKRKTTRPPKTLPLPPPTEVALDVTNLKDKSSKHTFPNGAVLYKNIFTPEFIERLAGKCLEDFPFREDTITNIENLGKEKLEKKIIDDFSETTKLNKSRLKNLRWTTLGEFVLIKLKSVSYQQLDNFGASF